MTKIEIRQAIGEATGSWWLFLVAAAWFVIALVVLRFNAPRHLVTRSPAPVKMNWEPGSTWSGGRSSLRSPRKLHVERGGGGSAVLWSLVISLRPTSARRLMCSLRNTLRRW